MVASGEFRDIDGMGLFFIYKLTLGDQVPSFSKYIGTRQHVSLLVRHSGLRNSASYMFLSADRTLLLVRFATPHRKQNEILHFSPKSR